MAEPSGRRRRLPDRRAAERGRHAEQAKARRAVTRRYPDIEAGGTRRSRRSS